jgi:putative FmdB family regulatory protein
MPTYSYRCNDCGVEFERVQKFSDKPLTRCPECKGRVRRVPQATGIVFKGSGWYINDSKGSSSSTTSAGKKSEKSSTDSGSTESATATATATESKPAETKTKAKAAASDD